MNQRLHDGVSSFSCQVQHHAACAFEISQHAICVFGTPECVLCSRFRDGATTCSTRIWLKGVVLPGICDVNLVSDTMGDGISSSAWSRSTSKPEKPTQGAPARAGCPTPAAKSAPSGAHSAQITQVCEWRTRPIAWPSRRRNRFLNSGLRFLTLDARPPRARTLPKPQADFHSRLERRFQKPKTSPIRPDAPRRLPKKSFLILDLECVKLCSK